MPAAWLAGLAGALAGAALFGGAPLAAIFWLTLGVVAAAPAPRSQSRRREPSRTLSIVHVIARLNVGGAALHVLQLAREQRRRGHDVVVVAGHARRRRGVDGVRRPTSSASPFCSCRRSSASSRCAPTAQRSASLRSIIRDATPRRPPHAHRESRRDRADRRPARRRRGRARSSTPTTATSSAATSVRRASGVFRLVERLLARTAGTSIAVSDEVRDDLVALRRRAGRAVRRRPVRVRPPGVERGRRRGPRAHPRPSSASRDETFVVGWAGRLTAIKRPLDLVRTLRRAPRPGVDARARRSSATASDRHATEALARELGVARPLPVRRLPAADPRLVRRLRRLAPDLRERGDAGRRDRSAGGGAAGRRDAGRRHRRRSSSTARAASSSPIGDIDGAGRTARRARPRPASCARRSAGRRRRRTRRDSPRARMADELEAVYRRLLAR